MSKTKTTNPDTLKNRYDNTVQQDTTHLLKNRVYLI